MNIEQLLKELYELDSYSEFDEDIKTCFDMVRLQDVERVIDKYKAEMFDKEKFKKEYIRMMDSLRENHKGEPSCNGAACSKCPLNNIACGGGIDLRYYVFEAIEVVEKWSKEHPIVTYKDKFIEVFGVDVWVKTLIEFGDNFAEFWDSEYKPPVMVESEDKE